MVQYCVVPGCTSQCNKKSKLEGTSFHSIPKNINIRKAWLWKIRRCEKKSPVSPYMRICSKHFTAEDFRELGPGRFSSNKILKVGAIPTVFSFTSPRKLKPPRRKIVKKTCEEIFSLQGPSTLSDSQPILVTQAPIERIGDDIGLCSQSNPQIPGISLKNNSEKHIGNNDDGLCLEPDVIIATRPADEQFAVDCGLSTSSRQYDHRAAEIEIVQQREKMVALEKLLTEAHGQIADLNLKVAAVKEDLAITKTELSEAKKYIDDLHRNACNNSITCERDFKMSSVKQDPSLFTYYTGFDSFEAFKIFQEHVNPNTLKTYSKKLNIEDQMLLVFARLRQGVDLIDLAFRFAISVKLAGFIFSSWVNEFYIRLGCLKIWPHRDIIFSNAPLELKEKFPNTVIILDGTELKVERPSSRVLQSQLYSTYKSHNTVKGLIGCDLKGGIIFISRLFSGGISDKKITEESNLYECLKGKLCNGEVLPNDVVMANKGFNIRKEIYDLGLVLNIPPMASNEQFTEEEVCNTRKIASCRVQVERAIGRVKAFKILSGVIPIANLAHLNQIWSVCCLLTGFRGITKNKCL